MSEVPLHKCAAGTHFPGRNVAVIDPQFLDKHQATTFQKLRDRGTPVRHPTVLHRQNANGVSIKWKTAEDRKLGAFCVETPVIDDPWRSLLIQ